MFRCWLVFCKLPYWSTCIDGYCWCPNNINRNPCTCLGRYKHIYTICPTYYFLPHLIAHVGYYEEEEGYSKWHSNVWWYFWNHIQLCFHGSGVHSQYEVHVISNYESDGQHEFSHTHITGTTYRCKCECWW